MSRIAPTGEIRQRAPRLRDKPYLAWIATLPCVACYCRGGFITRPVHVAHIRSAYAADGWRETGKSEKPSDTRTAPLCPHHHTDGPDAQHRMSERLFWSCLDVHPPAFCAALRAAYEARTSGADVIRRASQGEFTR